MLTSISGHVMLTLLPIFTVTFIKFWKVSYAGSIIKAIKILLLLNEVNVFIRNFNGSH